MHRHQPVEQPATARRLRDRYDACSYGNAIGYACVKARVAHWTPYQLRHTAATILRREFGLEVAQVILGHAHASESEIYAEVDRAKAIKVMSRIG
jgi:integrase